MKQLEAVAAPDKPCGPCSACCKLFEIDWLEAPKPGGKWCPHARPGQGCSIWKTLPPKCAHYLCVWKIDPDLGEEWRPDRARFILTHSEMDAPLTVLLDPSAPNAHRREPYASRLLKTTRDLLMGRGTPLLVVCGKSRALLFPDAEVPIPESVALHEVRINRYETPAGLKWRAEFPKD